MTFKFKPLRAAVTIALMGAAIYAVRSYEPPPPKPGPDPYVIETALAHARAMVSENGEACRYIIRQDYCPRARSAQL